MKFQGFDSAILNTTTRQEQEDYLKKFLKDPPRLEEPYDQKQVDEMKRLIKAFWEEKGVAVEVRSTVTPIPESRAARLKFDVMIRRHKT